MELSHAKDWQGGKIVASVLFKSKTSPLYSIHHIPVLFTLLFTLLFGSGYSFAESGRSDYDLDNDGLIEINDLNDLNEIRNNLDGTSLYSTSAGCSLAGGCVGFELTTNLDFDTNQDGLINASDQFWNETEGWLPLSNYHERFSAIFHGNDYKISNLYISRTDKNHVSLFGYIENATLSNIGLNGPLMKIEGDNNIGALVGTAEQSKIENCYSTGSVHGGYYVGGLVGYLSEGSSIYSSYSTGSVTGVTFNVGGLVGNAVRAHIYGSYATGSVSTYWYSVGGLVGHIYEGSVTASFASGPVSGDKKVGGLIGSAGGGATIEANYATGYLSSNDDGAATKGGLLGSISGYVNSVNNHWAIDITDTRYTSGSTNAAIRMGAATAAELSCPLHDNQDLCTEEGVLFVDWSSHINSNNEAYWDFGDNDELPGLLINGAIHRDSDGDGSTDAADHWRKTWGAIDDADNDGHPDRWHAGCDEQCRDDSGLTIDHLPNHPEAFLDRDLDGFPDAWTASCDANCQSNSPLILDAYLNDSDNDGLSNALDSRDNNNLEEGDIDIDADSNGLIDIYTLAQLNAIRYQLDGSAYRSSENAEANNSGCPQVLYLGEYSQRCHGYELKNDLNFDTNLDGQINEQDTYWNDGLGWLPLGEDASKENISFRATFDGHGYKILNLHINRPESGNIGLFGYVQYGDIRNIGLTGSLTSILGKSAVGAVAGKFDLSTLTESYSSAYIEGSGYYVGGLIGRLKSASIAASYFSGTVLSSSTGTGGLAGLLSDSHIAASFSTGNVTGRYSVGGLVGQGFGQFSIEGSFATGLVVANKRDAGGLLGTPTDWYGRGGVRMEVNYWASNTTGQSTSGLSEDSAGVLISELKCPTRENNFTCNSDITLYENWSSFIDASEDPYWDFGDDGQLPALVINSIIHRDSDNDSVFDSEDAFPSDPAASIDEDNDGDPDEWNDDCSEVCQDNSPLELDNDLDNDGIENEFDQFPSEPAASVDADHDGLPDEWNANCNAQCIADSGLELDLYPSDIDNDGVVDASDPDNTADNGAPLLTAVPDDIYISANSENGRSVSLEFSDNFFLDFIASDAIDGQDLTFSAQFNGQPLVIDQSGFADLPVGIVEIQWSATDLSGNTSLPMTQVVNVFPHVRFAQADSITGEPSTASILLELTGPSPVYPASVTVHAALNKADETVLNAQDLDPNRTEIWRDLSRPITLLIEEGDATVANIQGVLNLPIAQDFIEEADESLVFEITRFEVINTDQPELEHLELLIMPANKLHTLTVTEENLAPVVTVEVMQAGVATNVIDTGKGLVAVSVTINDPNGDDTHTYEWNLDSLGLGITPDLNLELDPSDWPLGELEFSIWVTDEHASPLSTTTRVAITTMESDSPEASVTGQAASSGGGGSIGVAMFLLLLSCIGAKSNTRYSSTQ